MWSLVLPWGGAGEGVRDPVQPRQGRKDCTICKMGQSLCAGKTDRKHTHIQPRETTAS